MLPPPHPMAEALSSAIAGFSAPQDLCTCIPSFKSSSYTCPTAGTFSSFRLQLKTIIPDNPCQVILSPSPLFSSLFLLLSLFINVWNMNFSDGCFQVWVGRDRASPVHCCVPVPGGSARHRAGAQEYLVSEWILKFRGSYSKGRNVIFLISSG